MKKPTKKKRTIVPIDKNARGKDARKPKEGTPGGFYTKSYSKYHN